MVRIVEEEPVVGVRGAMPADPGDQSVVIPLVNEHEVRIPERLVQKSVCAVE